MVGIVALVVLGIQGPVIAERSGKKLERALRENGPGPLGADARRMTRYWGLWMIEFSAIGLVLGVVWNMTTKPGTGTSIAAAVIGYAVGASLGYMFSGQAPRSRQPPQRRRTSASSLSRSRRRPRVFALFHLEGVAAAARAGDVRVVDREPGLQALDPVDLGAGQVGRAERVDDDRDAVSWRARGRRPAAPRSKPSAYWKPEQPPPWTAIRRTAASPSGSSDIRSRILAAALSVSETIVRGCSAVAIGPS